jgi:hypothetical protein
MSAQWSIIQGMNGETRSYAVIAALLLFASAAAVYAFPSAAHALQAKWSANLPNLCNAASTSNSCPTGSGWFSLFNVRAEVNYSAQVINQDTGQVLSCGSKVPQGTRLQYRFVPHKYSDIVWHGTGRGWDSPYGSWVESPESSKNIDPNMCTGRHSVGSIGGKGGYGTAYANFAVDPPTKTISGLKGSCTTASDGVSRNCIMDEVGSVPAVFRFAGTYGYFWTTIFAKGGKSLAAKHKNTCIRPHIMGTKPGSPYRVGVSAEAIPCTITVEKGPDVPTKPPQEPNLVTVGGACVVGQSYSMTMTANDTDTPPDKIRYLVDWNNDGTTDAFVPTTGYVNSGTAQTASKTFAAPGSKTVRVRSQDDKGAFSGWASLSVSCTGETDSTSVGLEGEEDAGVNEGDGSDGASINDLSLRALPSLVRTGGTTKVHWSSQNMSSCTVSGSNGDSWSGLNSPAGGEVSGAIDGLVTYTLTCRAGADTFTKTANVNILPSWVEK